MIATFRQSLERHWRLARDTNERLGIRMICRLRQIDDAFLESLRDALSWATNSPDVQLGRSQRTIDIEGTSATLEEALVIKTFERLGCSPLQSQLLLNSKYVWQKEGSGVRIGYGSQEGFIDAFLKILASYAGLLLVSAFLLPYGMPKILVSSIIVLVVTPGLYYFERILPMPRRICRRAIRAESSRR